MPESPDIFMHFVVDGEPVTSATHGVVAIITDKNPHMLPADTDAGNADGAELVYRVGALDIINGIVESTNPQGLTLDDLVLKESPDADETGQDFDNQ